ncbi:hypothetical protein [Bdellovibrio sp. HCB209]
MNAFNAQCKLHWTNTELYQEVKSIRDKGVPMADVVLQMKSKGWIAI